MPIEKFGWNKESLWGFIWHQGMGLLSFAFDVAVIYFLIHHWHMYYPYAVAIGFVAATLFNYVLTRSTIYSNTAEPHSTTVFYFFAIATAALFLTVGGTVYLHEILKVPLYVARVSIGIILSITGYVLDCFFVFKLR